MPKNINYAGLIIVALGIFLLLGTFGVIGFGIVLIALSLLFPLFIIYLGITVVFKGDESVKNYAQLFLVGAFALLITVFIIGKENFEKIEASKEYNLEMRDASLDFDIDYSMGEIEISDSAADYDFKIAEDTSSYFGESLKKEEKDGDKYKITVSSNDLNFWSFLRSADFNDDFTRKLLLNFNSASTVSGHELQIGQNLSKLNLNLDNFKFDKFEIDTNFSESEINFSDESMPRVIKINNSFGETKINLPDGLRDRPYRIESSTSLGEVTFFGEKLPSGFDGQRDVVEPLVIITINNSLGAVEIF